ncbi:MAG: methionyl-tRNA formyltransferase, partial [Lachnospiraceae bacterium]|nr:methionyl-tRNA formyltransferase [Candidatus Minthocola equi]
SAVILNGEKKTGVTTMYMDEGIDTGDMLLTKEIEIADKETCGSLEEKIAAAGAELILDTLSALEAGTLKRTPQEGEASYVKMMKKQAGIIDWNDSAVNIERKVRAFNPWPGSFTYYDGLIMKIYSADVVDCSGYAPGMVAEVKNRFVIQTGDGGLQINELQLEGKKRMQASDFLRGCKILPGEVLKSE